MKYEYFTTLDLGVIGELDVTVEYDGYHAIRRAVDDYDSVEVLHVWVAIGNQVVDIYDCLTAEMQSDLSQQCYEAMPTREDLAADAADHYYTQMKDARLEAVCN